jgi:hypothetical protein
MFRENDLLCFDRKLHLFKTKTVEYCMFYINKKLGQRVKVYYVSCKEKSFCNLLVRVRIIVFIATFNNIFVISWR